MGAPRAAVPPRCARDGALRRGPSTAPPARLVSAASRGAARGAALRARLGPASRRAAALALALVAGMAAPRLFLQPPRPGASVARRALSEADVLPPIGTVNEDEWIEVWDQSLEELALDVRELLITDANIFFVGPDTESYAEAIKDVTDMLNYTCHFLDAKNTVEMTEAVTGRLERTIIVPPISSVQRWPWALMYNGLTVWLDPDNSTRMNVQTAEKVYTQKHPQNKQMFGPKKPATMVHKDVNPPADPLEMWNGADIHVNLQERPDTSPQKMIMANIIEGILASPPKWRGWFQQAKIRGTIGADYQTPLEARRSYHSYGVSPRLNRLLTER